MFKYFINLRMPNRIIPYDPKLREYARFLRKNSTLSEVLLWQKIKNKSLGVQFHRQVPILDYIVDFYCHEILFAIEIDGNSHLYKHDYDVNRQLRLEKEGITFLRFDDAEVKFNLFNVVSSIIVKVKELKLTHGITPP